MTIRVGGNIGGVQLDYSGELPTFGGGSSPAGSATGYPFTPCPSQPTEAAAYLLDNITPEDAQYLASLAPNTDAAGAILSKDAARLAWHVAGGSDCAVTSSAGRRFTDAFNGLVQTYGGAVGPQTSSGGGGSVWDVFKDEILDPLIGSVKNVGTGAVAGAAQAAQGAQAGSSAAQTFGALLPTLLVIGLAALLLLPVLRRKG